jgi:CRISPR-associated Csx2 family protein
MIRNVFISFLGTSDYEPCNYVLDGNRQLFTRYVQEALIKFSCTDWTKDDRIFIFVTENARARNWNRLKEALNSRNLPPLIEAVDIPEEVSDNTIWSVFATIYDKLLQEDNLLIDITHGFRSSPMLLLTLINYSSFLKGTTVGGIFYGAFTAMRSMNIDYTPVWDLTSLLRLHEWTLGANEYIKFGNTERIARLARESAIPLIGDDVYRESARKITKFSQSVGKASELFSTVRGSKVYSADILNIVTRNAEQVDKVNFVAPLQPFMRMTIEKFAVFREMEILNFIPSVKYCIDHDLIQQGITFLQEGILSYALFRAGLKWETTFSEDKKEVLINRQMASGVINSLGRAKGNMEWNWHPEFPAEMLDKLREDPFCQQIARMFCTVADYRNDINHGGYICPREPQKFRTMLNDGYLKVKEIVGLNSRNLCW